MSSVQALVVSRAYLAGVVGQELHRWPHAKQCSVLEKLADARRPWQVQFAGAIAKTRTKKKKEKGEGKKRMCIC